MPTRHLSIRLDTETFERLELESRQAGQSRSELANVLLAEGLRMLAHPGIVFRAGPAGRRPGLAGGPDVWEVVRVIQGVQSRGEERVRQTAELTSLTPEQVRTTLRYYTGYSEEVDDWIRRVDEAATRAEAAWEREQELLRQ